MFYGLFHQFSDDLLKFHFMLTFFLNTGPFHSQQQPASARLEVDELKSWTSYNFSICFPRAPWQPWRCQKQPKCITRSNTTSRCFSFSANEAFNISKANNNIHFSLSYCCFLIYEDYSWKGIICTEEGLGILRQEWNESHKIETMCVVDRAASIVCAKIRSLLTVTITVCLICVLSISSCHALMIPHHLRAFIKHSWLVPLRKDFTNCHA